MAKESVPTPDDVEEPDELPDDESGDEEEEDEPAPVAKPKPVAKPSKPAAKPKPSRGTKMEVDARHYARVVDRLAALESAESERAQQTRDRERAKTEEIAPKDWRKAKQRIEAGHQAEIEARDRKIAAYENRLMSMQMNTSIRSGIDKWNKENPGKPVRASLVPHLSDHLRTRFKAEWDDEAGDDGAGDFVVFDPKTSLPAAEVIPKMLAEESYAGFLEASARPGAGARGGGMRPTDAAAAAGKGKGTGNPYADGYARMKSAWDEGVPGLVRPSIGLKVRQPQQSASNGQNVNQN